MIETPATEPDPITERTRAMMQLHNEMQDVTAVVREIKAMIEKRESRAEKIMGAFKRAINQFMSQL